MVDVGHVIEIYAEFSRSGATYTPYPDPRSHRIRLADLARPEVQQTLRAISDYPRNYPRKRRRVFETSRAPSASNSNVQRKWSSGLSTRVTLRHAFTVPVPGA